MNTTDKTNEAPISQASISNGLLSCPFCGCEAELMEDVGDYPTTYRVGCKNMIDPHYLDRWDDTSTEAIAAWNTRA
jgi:hypothetical protein